ncbi:hypothetical protein CU669_00370 [Paramagnetospirillum kuznetsovii]|uniref:Class I SAM-dependent methyltransferase n=1 Tax=Paramagnetospirillum kuznetsovii TaxID=2053833 RepID=A0A364P2T0_9PROT|nr:class I SAM-dependent methyltransferase [Paramagnetospirillum kuznetsovii]RAU23596.1 hypothetical protein CU669_00370 [Paramagnetospirillum kuznetsovii]
MLEHVYESHAEIEDRHWWFKARRRIVYGLVEDIMDGAQRRLIVDVGCGTGGNIGPLAHVHDCLGVDTSDMAVSIARTKYPHCSFRLGMAPESIVDVLDRTGLVLMMDVLEHIPDDRAALASLVEALRPGTTLLITVPADMRLWSVHDEAALHQRRYDMESLRRCWQGLPVKEHMLSPYNSLLYFPIRLARWLLRRLKLKSQSHSDFQLPLGPIEAVLAFLFGAERHRLLDLLRGRTKRGFRRGVSLIAVLERV